MQLDPLVDYGAEIAQLTTQIAAATAAGLSAKAATLTAELNGRVASLIADANTPYAATDTVIARKSDGTVYELPVTVVGQLMTLLDVLPSGASAVSEKFRLNGRASIGCPVPFLTPSGSASSSAIAFDVFPKGSPGDYLTIAPAWVDVCSTDIVADGSNFESVRIAKKAASYAFLSTAKGGTGTKRDLRIQHDGGGVSLGNVGARTTAPNGVAEAYSTGVAAADFYACTDAAWNDGDRKRAVVMFADTTRIGSMDQVYAASGTKADWRWTTYASSARVVDAMVLSSDARLRVGWDNLSLADDGKTSLQVASKHVLTAGATDDYAGGASLAPYYDSTGGPWTVTRHNYINLPNPTAFSSTVIADAAALRFDAAAGTHKAVDAGSTKATPGTVDAWVKVNINGAIRYLPAYASKTA